MDISPVYLLLPLILCVSLAFMLPVATPCNALIFANGYVQMKDMITTGLFMNICGLIVVFLAANTYLGLIFDLSVNKLPSKTPFLVNATLISINSTFN
jgi:solute carrier family 13 (sodium-dependent dicarboxylate transporter), member 2/3/5